MVNQKRVIKELKVIKGDANIVRISVDYRIGGMNYFTSNLQRRGLYLDVTPLTVTKGDGYSTTSYRGFSGSCMFIKELKRFSQKQLNETNPTKEQLRQVIDHVLSQNEIEVEEYSLDDILS